jgi:hypothetical protein
MPSVGRSGFEAGPHGPKSRWSGPRRPFLRRHHAGGRRRNSGAPLHEMRASGIELLLEGLHHLNKGEVDGKAIYRRLPPSGKMVAERGAEVDP